MNDWKERHVSDKSFLNSTIFGIIFCFILSESSNISFKVFKKLK